MATSQSSVAPASDPTPLHLSVELGRLGKHADGVAKARKLELLDADREHQLPSQSHLVQAEHASLLDAYHDQRAIWESTLSDNAIARPRHPQATGTVVAARTDGPRPSRPGLAEAIGTIVHVDSQHEMLEPALPDISAVRTTGTSVAPSVGSLPPAQTTGAVVAVRTNGP
jgi:hypothetical protein